MGRFDDIPEAAKQTLHAACLDHPQLLAALTPEATDWILDQPADDTEAEAS